MTEAKTPAKKKSTSIKKVEATDMNPTQMISLAVQQGADLDKLEKLMDLQERFEQREALKAFNEAMTDFKREAIKITRNAKVKYNTSKGETKYDHATLDHIATAIDPRLSEVGIVYRWNTKQHEDGTVSVTCILTHDLGHSEETTLKARPDDSGGKNSIQAIGSVVTYLQRYTLIAACGLTIGGMDNDGQSIKDTIDDVLVGNLKQLIKDSGADEKLFNDWLFTTFDVSEYNQLTQSQFDSAVSMLKKKKSQPKDVK